MNVLITGISGFVGSNLVSKLVNDYRFYGLDIINFDRINVSKTFSWLDIESTSFPFQTLPQFDAIIHLAGKAHDTKNQSAAQFYFDINTGLTQKIFDFFLESSAKKFIFFSSVKAAADSVVGDVLTEDVIPTPVGPYGESKIKAEEYIKNHFMFPTASIGEDRSLRLEKDRGRMPKNKQVYILRPCMIHGPGNKGNLNLLYNVVKKGIPWPLGDFDNRRSFTSIDNLCYVIEGLLNQDVPTGIYHMGDDEALSTNELIAIMCEAMEKQPRIWKMNKRFMEACAGLGTLLHLPLNTERLRKLTENYVVSNAKIKATLGIDKLPVTAKEGLMKTIRSFEETE
ncbi:NAD-dependent epimerase/dehydratase family protein [Bacteroides fragilis]|uniref:NAD-dependent epimerase/dehydratase family protein n=1 Tax=Bacteroides fragilis TaxID=817 RepID=UPI002030FD73|nr:NAD-dependent epimerase/dehydratase family protein [Bacteroides fragilis]MCM0323446.1 NAD-dependent epimerase/dehydratase family protein [Bacteroides fragilis]